MHENKRKYKHTIRILKGETDKRKRNSKNFKSNMINYMKVYLTILSNLLRTHSLKFIKKDRSLKWNTKIKCTQLILNKEKRKSGIKSKWVC